MNLSKDEILRLAREAGIDFDPRFGTAYTGNAQIERFSTICRADLVAENSQLREQNTELDKACADMEAEIAALKTQEPVATMHESPDAVWFTKGRDTDEYQDDVVHTFCYPGPQPSAAPVVEQLVEALECALSDDKPYIEKGNAATKAGQQWLKENKHG